MTEPNGSTLPQPDPGEPGTDLGTTLRTTRPGLQEPPETRGRTTIADGVVEKIAGIAAREVPGIHALGGGFTRTMGAMRDRVPGGHASAGRGVKVEVGEKQTAIDLQVVVAYGVSITDLAAEVRENVIAAVERMTGLEVVEVNIAVNDVHLPDEDTQETLEGRVH
ncbi:Asp23/Gls24 family envelope stress response protein [Streptomyces aquilus]|uniref:Asp23/Gls24 family envelope stress response protein n=1 Tax=Streptomyces aquilus TaxID=2548456 RepID=A0A3Q9C368_9ACTN|nr:Asp23/Gls24 family envelope stress response protein [Streptomyces aquilus]AZP19410.1 Asp23/Gls24 family envelope stress response protein [Streptomyces aquilus]